MEVDGISVAEAQRIENETVNGGSINEAGILILTTKGGTTISAGQVRRPILDSWPVGSIYFSDKPENPSTFLGGGEWTRWGQGRVPVGVDTTQPEFDSVNETGGAKTVTLTADQMPVHNHPASADNQGQHTHTYGRTPPGATKPRATGGLTVVESGDMNADTVSAAGAHSHNISTQNAGGGNAHNNLQPYITCYMWKRLS